VVVTTHAAVSRNRPRDVAIAGYPRIAAVQVLPRYLSHDDTLRAGSNRYNALT